MGMLEDLKRDHEANNAELIEEEDRRFMTTGISVGAVTEIPDQIMIGADDPDLLVVDVVYRLWQNCGNEVAGLIPVGHLHNDFRMNHTYRMKFSVIDTNRLNELLEIECLVGGMGQLRYDKLMTKIARGEQ